MRIAVTGAAGRVGRGVVDLATRTGHSVVAIDRESIASAELADQSIRLDMRDYDAVVEAIKGCDALIHLAAIPGPGRLPDHVVHDTNVVASYHALRAAAEVGIRNVGQASSVNAIGGRFSRWPRYDYFPLDEAHPSYAEDPYSLSKWECEQQAEAIARGHPDMSIASLRLHGVVPNREAAARWIGRPDKVAERHLWGYVLATAVSRAFLASITADFEGHESFFIVAPDTMVDTPSRELAAEHYPDVPIRSDLPGTAAFFDCRKAESMLGWLHDED